MSQELESGVEHAMETGQSKVVPGIKRPLGQKIHFSCQEHEAAFEKLTERQKQYIVVYMETGSPTQVAKRLGLTGSVKGVGKKLNQIVKLMGLRSVRELNPNKAQAAEGRATAVELKKMVEQQRYRCALSGRKLTPETAQLDHKVPLSEGGSNLVGNLQWLDEQVNRAKGTMSQDEFIRMCKQVAQWTG